MPESSPQQVRPEVPPPAPPPGAEAFSLRKRFPGDSPLPSPAPKSAPVVAKKPGFRRIALPVVLLVLVVGAIAYVAQNLPSWRKKSGGAPIKPSDKELLAFPARQEDGRIVAVWDTTDPSHVLEVEQGAKGRYDFLCKNVTAAGLEIGLMEKKCDCSDVSFTVLPEGMSFEGKQPDLETLEKQLPKDLTWHLLQVGEDQGVALPAGRTGLVRVSWKTRKSEGDMLNLRVEVWGQPAGGRAKERQYYKLDTFAIVVPALLFDRTTLNLGEIGSRSVRGEFHCWSATRTRPEVTLAQPDDPLFEWELATLTADECKDLQKALNGAPDKRLRDTRVKCAYRIGVIVHEAKAGRQLDQGAIVPRTAPLLLNGAPLDHGGTLVEGTVRGDVQVAGDIRDGGVVNGQVRFGKFRSSIGARANLQLSAAGDVTLKVTDKRPPYLDVRLSEPKQVGNRKIWRLEVIIPQGVPTGALPADSAILLQKTIQGAPPRQISIPILGNAVQG